MRDSRTRGRVLRVTVALLLPWAVPDALARAWYHGAVVVDHVRGGVSLREVGEGKLPQGEVRPPLYVSNLLQVRSDEGGETLGRMSNGFAWLHRGRGYFGIERFEQAVEPTGEERDAGGHSPVGGGTLETRMILNLRRGLLVMDSRSRREPSQILVETPVGAVSAGAGLWMMRIDVNRERGIYDFEIACVDGSVGYRDRRGSDYTVRSGQRLSGAGSAGTPAIEVATLSENEREIVARMERLLDDHPMDGDRRKRLAEAMRPLKREISESDSLARRKADDGEETRPIVLEYVPRPEPVVPYQGDVRPPSAYEADLF